MKITEEQKQQLLNLNDSRVNEILGVKKLEVGKWYKSNCSNYLVFREKNTDNYGIRYPKKWSTDLLCSKPYQWEEATNEEVETALIDEAKKRGFKGRFNYIHVSNELWNNSDIIFNNGKWAEVIEKPNKQEIINQINELLKQL